MSELLENTMIFRGGVTAPKLNFETGVCSFKASNELAGIELRFTMASKGGGETEVVLQIGMTDLSKILQTIASDMPQSSSLFLECATIANKRNVEHIVEGRLASNKLVKVKEFVDEKYREVPFGQDEREGEICTLVDEAIVTLRELD